MPRRSDPATVLEITRPLILLADCEVFYEGRASSALQRGHYLLIFKADGSFMIHGARLTVPVNYQPAPSRLYRTAEGYLCVSKKEAMRVVVHCEVARLRLRRWDDFKATIVRTERELCDKLAKTIRRRIPNVVAVYQEYPTEHGAVDLVAVDRRGVYHVVEVKRARATVQAGVQLRKYLEAIAEQGHRVRGYVAAPAIAENARAYYRKQGYAYLGVKHTRSAGERWSGCPEALYRTLTG